MQNRRLHPCGHSYILAIIYESRTLAKNIKPGHRPQGILESFLIIYAELKPYFKVGAMLLLVLAA